MRKIAILLMIGLSVNLIAQKFDKLALTPPIGWNSWNHYGCDINEKIIRETADAMVSSGMKDAGYQYVVIDDCWHGGRDSLGFIYPDPIRFPSGIKALSDYVHSKGLKFGIYSCAGIKTCGGHPGGRGHEYQDAITYARWGVDYLKYDWCNTDKLLAEESYKTMRDALFAAKRPVVLSICEWGDNKPWIWGAETGHLWRTTGDITNCWGCDVGHGIWTSWGVLKIIDMQKDLRKYAGPGHWNDPDMLEVGNGMTTSEDRAHFSMWCMLAAPLIAGNDLHTMSKETIDILTNKEAIAVDQDSLGIQGFRYTNFGNVELYVKPLKNNEIALCFLNRGETNQKIEFDWKKYTIEDGLTHILIKFESTTYNLRDLWAKKNIGNTKTPFIAEIPPHDIIMLRLSK
jgi:alpha-galactosidase